MSLVSKSSACCIVLFFVFILHFGIFEETPHNPIGILYVNELYLVICLAFTLFYLLASVGMEKRDFNILFSYGLYSSVVFILLPAIFSNLYYGQPLIYGIIEERRVLFCFSFAVLLFLAKNMKVAHFEHTFFAVVLLSCVLAWMFKFGALPDLRDKVASFDRPDRSSIGSLAQILGYFYAIQIWNKGSSPIDGSEKSKTPYLILACFILLTLVFATQTRQLIFLSLCFTLLCLKSKSVIWVALSCILLSPFYLFPELITALGLNVDFYTQSLEDGPTDGVREQTISYIFMHLHSNNWLPSGSLSLMWNNGFIPHFGEYFFLSDVGIFGTLFRFGFLAFFIVPLSLFCYYRFAKRLCLNTNFTLICMLAFMVIWPLQGIFEYMQATIAFLLVIQALKGKHLNSSSPVSEPYLGAHALGQPSFR
ncbi:hypothetical protein [Pseudomonas duriflava]|nr:hypothetical protein [Pseudomonas duriflava]